MIRSRSLFLLAVASMLFLPASVQAVSVTFSLNLQFNALGDFNSGGTWTAVAKSDPGGIAGVSMYLKNTTFGSFLAPPEFPIQLQFGGTVVRNIAIGDDLSGPPPWGVGVIGSVFPSTYVDPSGLAPFGGNPNFGSFSGGIALATGTFAPGVVPDWTTSGSNSTDANIFNYAVPPVPISAHSIGLTVRYFVPEPATFGLAGVALIGLIAASRRSAN